MKKFSAVILLLAFLLTGVVFRSTVFASDTYQQQFSGVIREVHGDDLKNKKEVGEKFVLDDGKKTYDINLSSKTRISPGQNVRLQGVLHGNTILVANGGVTTYLANTTATPISGNQKVAVVLFNFSNDSSQPWTPDSVRGTVFNNSNSVKAFYQASSNSQLSLSGDVYGWYSLAQDNSGCAYYNWQQEANADVAAAGVDLSTYQYVVYAHPYTSSCPWSGLGYLPGNYSWINGSMTMASVAHELGHNFGIHHASSFECTDGTGKYVPFSNSCISYEYGDPFSIMGSSASNLHTTWHQSQLGWTIPTVIMASGQYNLAPVESSSGTRLLSVLRTDGTYLQLEFRQRLGVFDNFNTYDPVVNGVTVRIAPSPDTVTQSHILDMTADGDFSNSALAVGKTFTDTVDGLSITTKSVSSTGAVISIFFGTDTQPPSAPSGLAASTKKSAVTLTWKVSTDNIGVAGYHVYRNGAQISSLNGTSTTDSPGKGNWTYTVRAYDAAGNLSASSNSVSVRL
jgi:hypothetical protein